MFKHVSELLKQVNHWGNEGEGFRNYTLAFGTFEIICQTHIFYTDYCFLNLCNLHKHINLNCIPLFIITFIYIIIMILMLESHKFILYLNWGGTTSTALPFLVIVDTIRTLSSALNLLMYHLYHTLRFDNEKLCKLILHFDF